MDADHTEHPPVRHPPKPRPGDTVAVLSPSSGLAGLLPRPHELGLRRLREEFGLVVREYPTTRTPGASAAARAADLHAAFADPEVKAVIATIGGDDQITVIPHLDAELLRAHPKPFFGYSDNTNLLLFLRSLGMVAYHGASVMTEFGRPGALHPLTAASARAALFDTGPFELTPAESFRDLDRPWDDPATFEAEPETEPAGGWTWRNADRVVEGRAWGGNLEILTWMLAAARTGPRDTDRDGEVLFVETSEELPPAEEVFRMLRNLGERGLLARFAAVLVGRAKARSLDHLPDAETRARYRADQRAAVERVLEAYAPTAPAVFDVDLGHTDPQLVIPVGGLVRVDGPARRIHVTY
ncbi:S66 family peptidase [Streptomyces sp. BI20]|uniref:S66 family peptidase n=1 Tax=Streptomyces sp. BI20 TaxID=3403460 RepID=UPI003C7556C4